MSLKISGLKRRSRIKGYPDNVFRLFPIVPILLLGIISIIGSTPNRNLPFPLTLSNAGPSQHVPVGSVVVLDGQSSDFRQATEVNIKNSTRLLQVWKLLTIPEGSNAVLSGRRSVNPEFTADIEGEYVIQLETQASNFSSDTPSRSTVLVTAYNGNCKPVAEAGPVRDVTTGTTVTLDGTLSSDADGDPLSYNWSFGADSPTAPLSDELTGNPVFTTAKHGDYRLRLTVNDGTVDSREDFVIIRSHNYSQPPVSISGPDQNVITGTQVFLDGSSSYDLAGGDLTYNWRILIFPVGSLAFLNSTGSVSPSFVPDIAGTYVIRLVVANSTTESRRNYDHVNLDRLMIHAAAVSESPKPLTLLTSLPYHPDQAEVGLEIQIDGVGADTVRVIPMTSPDAGTDATALRVYPAGENEVSFIINSPAWSMVSRSHPDPVHENDTLTVVLQRQSDSVYFQLVIGFSDYPALFTAQIDSLEGQRCGSSPDNCP